MIAVCTKPPTHTREQGLIDVHKATIHDMTPQDTVEDMKEGISTEEKKLQWD